MTKVLLTANSFLAVTFAGVILVSVLLGSLGTPPTALYGLDDCGLPCWNGITPGQNNVDRAIYRLSRAGYVIETNPLRWRYMTFRSTNPADCMVTITYDSLVYLTDLSDCPGLSLGDVMTILGQPDGVVPAFQYDALVYRGGRVAVVVRRERCQTAISPYTAVDSIQLRAQRLNRANSEQVSPANPLPWRGFVRPGYYGLPESSAQDC